jgi:hypothetical protein
VFTKGGHTDPGDVGVHFHSLVLKLFRIGY